MGNDIETGRRERNTQITYLVSITFKSIENKNKPFYILYQMVQYAGFYVWKNSEKKILYTNLYMGNIV